jgi:hypothetical protein
MDLLDDCSACSLKQANETLDVNTSPRPPTTWRTSALSESALLNSSRYVKILVDAQMDA